MHGSIEASGRMSTGEAPTVLDPLPIPGGTPLLSVVGASKAYSGVPALVDASLDLRVGEVHALMGENGAGKSTLIKVLAGAVTADSCRLALRGVPISIDGPQSAFRHGLRFIHQELNVVPQLSVAENIFLGQRYPQHFGGLVDWKAINRAAVEALARLRITGIKPTTKMARLSTGDQMLVRIAGTLVSDSASAASVFVMDEPTAALTGEESERLFQVIAELRGSGCAVLYVSHRMDEVMRICDRVTVMRDGRTVKTLALADTSKKEIIRLMTGRDVADAYPPRGFAMEEATALDVRSLAGAHVGGVSFTLSKGEILGVAGLANAGQSELLRLLIGADFQNARDVTLAGAALRKQTPGSAWRRGFAYVPRERRREGLMLSRSISDNVTLPHLDRTSLLSIFLDRRRERAIAGELGRQVRLKATRLSQLCRQLSGGNQQKVVFARAIAGKPSILLLDEPTRGVDVGAKFDIYTLMRELSAAGTSIVMSSSDLPELLGLCDRILIMRDGRQHQIVRAAGLTQADLLHLFYD
jgi:ABC-type sugar transport system ATPase subunit